MKVTDNSTYRLMQTNLDRITNDLLGLRNQGATGLKLNRPSDDPGAIRPVLTTRTQLQQNDRYLETMGQAGDKMAATDGHLAHVENIMVRVKEIAVNSVNSSLSSSDLATLAEEIAELKNELLDAANAMVDGKYIFAGYQENTVPFTKNGNYDPALYNVNDVNTWPYFYNGDHNPTRLEITPGEFIEANLTGNQLFMGITNKIAASGYATTNPYQGETMTSGPIGIGTLGNDITITPVDGLPVTIAGADLTDTNNNYAETVAGLFSALGTGLIATVNAATADLGPLSLTGFNETENDEYSLEISAGGLPVSVTIDGPSGGYDYTLEGLAAALANTPNASNLTPTGGTLSNGVKYDISSGSLLLTGPANGSEIELTEVITDGVVTATAPTGGVGGGTPQTVYGTINVTTNSATSVEISGTGLTSVGLKADTLNGASGRIDLFSVLTRTEEAIRAGNLTEINSRLEDLDIAADQNRGLRSQLGARAKRIDTAILHQQDARVDLKQILSRYQDADIIEVYNDIMQKENAFKAALNVTARVSQISILDYF
jgi:flagellar hook-associated protein 3 FlgL